MAEDLSYLRGRLDEACNGIARLEEQVKNLFHRYEEQASLKIDVVTQENRIKALESAKEKSGGRVWEVVAIVIAAVVGAVSGRWGK